MGRNQGDYTDLCCSPYYDYRTPLTYNVHCGDVQFAVLDVFVGVLPIHVDVKADLRLGPVDAPLDGLLAVQGRKRDWLQDIWGPNIGIKQRLL